MAKIIDLWGGSNLICGVPSLSYAIGVAVRYIREHPQEKQWVEDEWFVTEHEEGEIGTMIFYDLADMLEMMEPWPI